MTDLGEAQLTLRVPRTIPVVLLTLGVLWGTPLTVALADGRAVNIPFAIINSLIAVGLIVFGTDTALVRVVVRPHEITVRRWLRRWTLPTEEVRGIALLAGEGVPQLRIVTRGDPVVVRAWGLQARHPDGELEPAGPALVRFGADHGIKVRVRSMLDPMAQ
ncbi:hypothetical protein BH23ACT9_BH23ACT9_18620 [soil metagenome]